MSPVGHGVSYSTWNPRTLRWDYWVDAGTPLRAGVIAPPPSIARRPTGVAPEQAARRLPAGATKVGDGDLPRGLVALEGVGALGGAPRLLALAVVGYLLFRLLEKKR